MCGYIDRPMYIASKDSGYPDGHNSVAYALRNSLEPLLKVPWLFSLILLHVFVLIGVQG